MTAPARLARTCSLALLALLASALPAAAQEEGVRGVPRWRGDDPRPRPGGGTVEETPPGGGRLRSWIILEEEEAPEPPLLRLSLGALGWIEHRTRVRADEGGVPGTDLRDLEEEQGLQEAAVAPWLEMSLGGIVRVGGDISYYERRGELQRQEQEVVFDGVRVAGPGDLARARFDFLTASAFLQWDPLYGRTYRIGLTGGIRYFRFELDLEGVQATGPTVHTPSVRERGELISPFFGGHVELTPFPYLQVRTQIQFMNWSWREIRLKDARFLEFRLGAILSPIPGLLGFGLEYRFSVIRAETRLEGSSRFDGAVVANGLAFFVHLEF